MDNYLHKIAMLLILIGGLILFYLAFAWFVRGNTIMGVGMLTMGIIALSNFYLHLRMMKSKDRHEQTH